MTPAAGCPTISNPDQLVNDGTISGPTGEYRVCTMPARFTASSTLPFNRGILYRMNGRVDVGTDGGPAPDASDGATDSNVNLTMEPGVRVYAAGSSFLMVNRGNRLTAVGTQARPIIFTSRDNVQGLNNDSSSGQWGGVVLAGRAPVTDCIAPGATPGSVNCERQVEGAAQPALFGGATPNDKSGDLAYVQIRYSGFVLSNNKELQALTAEAVGSGTTLDHIQSHRSSDDGAEFFGGNFNLKYYIATAADDDSLDVDTGARVNIQYALLLQKPGEGDALFEIDSNGNEGDTPRTNLKVVNFTAYQPDVSSNNEGNDKASALFRGNADVTLYNGLIVTPNNECVRMTSNTSAANRATLTARSVGLECSGSGSAKFIGDGSGTAFTAADVAGFFTGSASNDIDLTGALMNVFVNSATADAFATTDPTTLASSFFSAAPTPYHIGAAWSGNTSWAAGWTCNSSYAPLGGLTDCTTLPVY